MTTFLNNFAAWQQSVRRQAELIREKGGMSTESHELAEAVFTAASVIRRAFRDARQHLGSSSSASGEIKKLVDTLLSASEEEIKVGSPLEAYGTDFEVGSVTFQTLCEDVVEGADLQISKVSLGTAYGFIVTPSRFPYRSYYVHWKELEAALTSFALLEPNAEPEAILESGHEVTVDDADGHTELQQARAEVPLDYEVSEIIAQGDKGEPESAADNELDPTPAKQAADTAWADPPNSHGHEDRNRKSNSNRFIPRWLGESFWEAISSQAGELQFPKEFRAIWLHYHLAKHLNCATVYWTQH